MTHTTIDRRRRQIIMVIILIGILMAVIDGIVVSIALPTITRHFSVPVAESQWTITAYLVTMTSLLLIFGRVSEYTGRTRLFTAGLSIFTVSSLACGLAPTLSLLILFRVIQAIGAAMVFSISGAILFLASPPGEQGRAMGYIGSTVAMGSIAGPILGGFLVDALGWEYIFLINVPIGVLLLAIASRYLKIEERRSETLDMDWVGALSLVALMVSLILLLGDLAIDLNRPYLLITYAALFSASLVVFLANERKHRKPLLDLSIFSNRRFSLPTVSMVLYFVAIFMINIVGPFYFEGVMGLRPSQVGLIFLISPMIMVIAAPITGLIYDRRRPPYFAWGGMVIAAGSLMLLAYFSQTVNLPFIVLSFVPMAVGGALFQSPNNTEIMRALPLSQAGIASSVTATGRNLGMALGVSIAGILASMQLHGAGYYGEIMRADPAILSTTISNIIVIAGALCLAAAITSALRAGASA